MSALAERLAERVAVPGELRVSARLLDKHYIPTRYPNGFDSAAPTDFYTEPEARTAIGHAEAILEFCRRQMGGSPGR